MRLDVGRFGDSFEAMRDLQRFLDRAWWDRNPFYDRRGLSAGDVFPAVNVFEEKDDRLVVMAELPGVSKERLEIQIRGDVLTIEGERALYTEDETKNMRFYRRERDAGAFNRSFQLPYPVDPSTVKAQLEQGVLKIELEKAPEARARRVAVS
ncbi:MAG: Hsp20/alpha crystallin family protein [Leptospiraceae bacterium]|nr:Hsp20/alpha crystallin family protein [Leptospiraceae bacterium]MCP5485909.1 Hsp20/alpha crystallin family protein [Spirochaetales bacterium]